MEMSKKVVRDIMARQMREDPAYAQQIQAVGRWTGQQLQQMSTEAIIAQLRSWDIPFEVEQFATDLRRLGSAERVSDEWGSLYQLRLQGFDADFPFLAALELHPRLLPDIVTTETLDDWMQEGYGLLEQKRLGDACEIWLRVWKHLKQLLPSGAHTVEDAECLIRGNQAVYNWCQDLEMMLGNAGNKDPTFHEQRIAYCREFCDIFRAQEDLLSGFMSAEAESLFALGRPQEGEDHCRQVVARFPLQAWSYIAWGDAYWLWCGKHVPKDHAKAEAIYLQALAQPELDEPVWVHERLVELYCDWDKAAKARQHWRYADQYRLHPTTPAPAKRGKIGRNEPCPCGSGKKYKRCCGAS